MSIYSEFLDDAKEIIEDLGIDGQTADASLTFKCMISDPVTSQQFAEGGFIDRVTHSVRLPAVTTAWNLSDGTVGSSGPTIASGNVVPSLAYGKKLMVNGKGVRISSVAYKRGSAWVTLQVIDDGA